MPDHDSTERLTHPSWCTGSDYGGGHESAVVHIETVWSAPGRGLDINLVDIGRRGGALDPVVRLHFGGAPRAELLTLTESRRLATTLVELAALADAG
jgi:hypothetical protein